MKRDAQELGRPDMLHANAVYCMVRHANINKEGCLMAHRESDQLIVLGGRESRPQGEGADTTCSRTKEK